MLLPIRTNMPLRRTPLANYGLLVTNIAIYLITARGPSSGVLDKYVLQASYPQLHQFLTHAFLHGSFLHLAGNMLFLYVFGNNINDRLGNVGYLAFYLAAAFFAGLGHVYMEQSPAVGASGAIAAVTGMYLILFARTKITVVFWVIFIGTIDIAAMIWILLSFGKDLWYSITGEQMMIAYSAHAAGYLFGFGVGLILLLAKLIQPSRYDLLSFFRSRIVRHRPTVSVQVAEDFTSTQREVLSLRQEVLAALSEHDREKAVQAYRNLLSVDPAQVMPAQTQLDLANELMARTDYPQAAAAYEVFLKSYPNYQRIGQVQLMLGLLYNRYLNSPEQARQYLDKALELAPKDSPSWQMCRSELARISGGGAD